MDKLARTSGGVSAAVLRTVSAYDSIAKHYAETWFDDAGMEAKLDRFLNRVAPESTVLDAGCGPGRDVLAIVRRGFDCVGVDLSSGISEVMRRDIRTADSSDMLSTAFERLQECECHSLPVVHHGRLVGLLTAENVGEFLMVQSALGSRRPGASAAA